MIRSAFIILPRVLGHVIMLLGLPQTDGAALLQAISSILIWFQVPGGRQKMLRDERLPPYRQAIVELRSSGRSAGRRLPSAARY